VKTLN